MPTILLTTFIPLEIYDRSYDPVKRYHVLTPRHAPTGSLLYLKNHPYMYDDFLLRIMFVLVLKTSLLNSMS